MKGTILDFLKLAADEPEFAKGLLELGGKYDFAFTAGELSYAELEAVVGGVNLNMNLSTAGEDGQLANIDMQNMLQKEQHTRQLLSGVSKMLHDTSQAVVRRKGECRARPPCRNPALGGIDENY